MSTARCLWAHGRAVAVGAGVVSLGLVSGCGSDEDRAAEESEEVGDSGEAGEVAESTEEPADDSDDTTSTTSGPITVDLARDELVAMADRDQAGRLGGDDPEGDVARTERLKEIIEAIGWPRVDDVGPDAAEAAWLIAQHSDLDPDFQVEALELLTAAAEEDQASWGNVAYLTDRVAVGAGEPQTYGTQIGCGEDGPAPATPILDEANVNERRAEAGLDPIEDYYAELEAVCAEEGF